MCLDANDLYQYAMCSKLPLKNYKWVDKPSEKTTSQFILDYNEETNDTGYLLEVDIEYPKDLDNAHSDLPFLPYKNKKFTVNTKYSQPIQNERKRNHEFLPKQTEKLICTLEDKQKYVIQITTLKQALEHGLILKTFHRAISYHHSKWLKPYIDLNTKLRNSAKNVFENGFL